MSEAIKSTVRDKYGAIARTGATSSEASRAIAMAFGYSEEELSSIPADANLGVSCGNPTATAGLRPGEVVVDLGSGGGLDVFLAAQKVGPTGKAIGIDMTPDMVERARANAAKAGIENVEFHVAEIESLPLAETSVDCVISNCVLNLVPDKNRAFAEIFRVLKPGGRLAVSDIALKKPLPEELAQDLMAYVGCIAGAILIDDYVQGLKQAGFDQVQVVDTGADLNAYAKAEDQSACCTPQMVQIGEAPAAETCCTPSDDADLLARLKDLLQRYDVNEFAASVRVYALKPSL